ncbi:MAG: MAPEG family protein [Alphaproteobacteria bacterium]|nr:MAPEG family protein [Alphaproteobacteria bacterium]
MTAWLVLVTLLALLFYFWTGIAVARARAKYGVKAPAITGNPDFERTVRVQANTLEWLPLFLGSLWLFAMYWPGWLAAAIGVVWIVGRFMYMQGYIEAAEKRSMGFLVQSIAVAVLFIGALIGAVMSLVDAGLGG